MLHLEWIGLDQERKTVLSHSVSRDAVVWSNPNTQRVSEIDAREIMGAHMYSSGDFYLLVYVVRIGRECRVVTKVSRDARTWKDGGPPEFVMPDSPQITMPEMVFTSEGARLFYSEPLFADHNQKATRGWILRSAFCPKNAYIK